MGQNGRKPHQRRLSTLDRKPCLRGADMPTRSRTNSELTLAVLARMTASGVGRAFAAPSTNDCKGPKNSISPGKLRAGIAFPRVKTGSPQTTPIQLPLDQHQPYCLIRNNSAFAPNTNSITAPALQLLSFCSRKLVHIRCRRDCS